LPSVNFMATEPTSIAVRSIALIAVLVILSLNIAWADLDVNAVSGVIKIDGSPAPAGTSVRVLDRTSGKSVTTSVDGPNVPPFQRGAGRYDTGDVPAFSTGDRVVVSVNEATIYGETSKTLSAGTTTVNLNANTDSPPSVSSIPKQHGYEDVAWELDLEPYISDPDTPESELLVTVHSDHIEVEGKKLLFCYPQGVSEAKVRVYVQDDHSTVTCYIDVEITSVNDPPSISEIPELVVLENSAASIDLASYVSDPDDEIGDLTWSIASSGDLEAEFRGSLIEVSAQEGAFGYREVTFTVGDPGGLSENGTLQVKVEANISALTLYYEGQIEELSNQISELTEANSDLVDQVSQLQLQVSNLEQENRELEAELGDLGEGDASDAEEIRLLEAENQDLEDEISQLQEVLNDTITGYETIIGNLNETRSKAQGRVIALEKQVETLESRITEIGHDLMWSESNCSLQAEIAVNLSQRKVELEAELAEKQQDIDALKAEIDDLEDQIGDLEKEKGSVILQVEQLTSNLEETQEENSELRARIRELSNTAPAKMVEGNASTNTTQGNEGLLESLVARGAHLARDSYSVVSAGMSSGLALLVVAVVVISSAVAIAARTSWIQLGPSRKVSAEQYWKLIEEKTRNNRGESKTASRPKIRIMSRTEGVAGEPSAPPEHKRRVAASSDPEKSAFFVTRKPGIKSGVRKAEANMTDVDMKADETSESSSESQFSEKGRGQGSEARRGTTRRIGSRRSHVSPSASALHRKSEMEETARKEEAEPNATEKAEGDKGMDFSSLSDLDRQYIKSLLDLGFTEEAREELNKRSNA